MPEKPTILVVDDSRTVRAAMKKYLANDFDVLEAEDGEAGWEVLQSRPEIQLIISDIQMPRLDGYGFICRIRAANEENIRNNPVVVITSAEDEVSRERAYACGANDFVLKPLEFSDLKSRLHSQIGARIEGRNYIGQDMRKYEDAIEDAVLEAPSVGKALRILKGEETGALDPHIIDLCLEVIPLFEYLVKSSSVDVESEVASIKMKLESQAW